MKGTKTELIVISGGGTGGPSVTPLAMALAYRRLRPGAKFIFLGSNRYLETSLFKEVLRDLGADYFCLPAGKWRRYFSAANFFDIFRIVAAFFSAIFLFIRRRPDLIVSAGSFASVPVVWAAKLFGVKIFIHQQDIRPGLANRLMSPIADRLSVAFAKSLADYGSSAVFIGNPAMPESREKNNQEFLAKFQLNSNHPLIFVTGGGSGALGLNKLVEDILPILPQDWQVVHQTGLNKNIDTVNRKAYFAVESLSQSEFQTLVSLADLIISRAGLGALTTISYYSKPCILVPMPKSHQEDNAAYFSSLGAALVLNQDVSKAQDLLAAMHSILDNEKKKSIMTVNMEAAMPRDAAQKGAVIMAELLAK